jgi:hypothetical protein
MQPCNLGHLEPAVPAILVGPAEVQAPVEADAAAGKAETGDPRKRREEVRLAAVLERLAIALFLAGAILCVTILLPIPQERFVRLLFLAVPALRRCLGRGARSCPDCDVPVVSRAFDP